MAKLNNLQDLGNFMPHTALENKHPENQHKQGKHHKHNMSGKPHKQTSHAQYSKLNLKDEDALKPIMAAYLNLARLNMFNTLINICRSAGIDPKSDNKEERMYKLPILKRDLAADQANNVRRLFYLHFPFLKILDFKGDNSLYDETDNAVKEELSANINDLQAVIKSIAFVLNWYRNKYSHFNYNSTEQDGQNMLKFEKKVGVYLKQLVTAAPRAVKARFKGDKNKQQEKMLPEGAMNFIHQGKMKITGNGENKKAEWNKDYFLYPLSKDKNNPDKLSTVGLITLCSLLLEKKHIHELLQKSGFLASFSTKTGNNVELSRQAIIFEVMSIYRIVLPQRKLNIEKSEIQVALDMLNELKKCPEELFDLLSDKDKEEFAITSEDNERVLLRRYSDRFPQLILSYFDSTAAAFEFM